MIIIVIIKISTIISVIIKILTIISVIIIVPKSFRMGCNQAG